MSDQFLRRPDNGQLCAFVSNRDGWVQLRTLDTITPMTRWYATAAVQACNPDVNVATLKVTDPRLTGMVYDQPQEAPPHQHWLDVQQARIEWNWKHVFIDADMLGKFSAGWEGADTEKSIGIRLCPLWKPRTLITVFAESMRPAA